MDDAALAKWLRDGPQKLREIQVTGQVPHGFNFWLAADALTALLALLGEATEMLDRVRGPLENEYGPAPDLNDLLDRLRAIGERA